MAVVFTPKSRVVEAEAGEGGTGDGAVSKVGGLPWGIESRPELDEASQGHCC